MLMWQQYVTKRQAISESICLQIQLESNKIADFMNTYKCLGLRSFVVGLSIRLTTHLLLWIVLVCRVICLIPVHTYLLIYLLTPYSRVFLRN